MEPVFSEEMARRLLQAINEQQATGRTDVDVFPAAVAAEVGILAHTNTFFAAVGYLEAEGYIDPSPNATLVGGDRLQDHREGHGLVGNSCAGGLS